MTFEEFFMKKTTAYIAMTCFMMGAFAIPAGAAPVGQVIKACDDMHSAGQTCNYGIKGNALVGCTSTTVFVCPADGSRQCTGSANTSGKCNEDGTAARRVPNANKRNLKGDDLLQSMKSK
jgi:hypothetical protein